LSRRGASQRALVVVGIALMTIGMAVLSLARPEAGYWAAVSAPMVLIGAGQGLAFGPLTGAAVAGARPEEAGAASGAVNAIHQIGGTFGVGALTSLAVGAAGLGSEATAVVARGTVGFTTAAALLTAAAVVALV